jgi:two-component SAPR family response regulator
MIRHEGTLCLRGGVTVQVELFTFGVFDMRINGGSVLKKSGRTSKNLELLKYFITHRNQKLVPERIIESIWTAEELGSLVKPTNALRTQIFRLRQNLAQMGFTGTDDPDLNFQIVFENGFYTVDLGPAFEIDTDEFMLNIEQGNAYQARHPDRAILAYKKAIALYKGEYLAENPFSEWLFLVRGRYHRQFCRAALRLLDLLHEQGLFEQIVAVFDQIIIHEPFSEPFHIHFIRALMQLGDYTTARTHYDYITEKLYREMALQPTPALKDLYQEILAERHRQGNADLAQRVTELAEGDALDRSLCCDETYFKYIYNFERRQSLRSDRTAFLGLITICKKNGALTAEEAEGAGVALKTTLFTSLRKGDAFCQLGSGQMALILTDVLADNLQLIAKRIEKRARRQMASPDIQMEIVFKQIDAADSFMASASL